MSATTPKEKYRLFLSNDGKIRNRAEAHLVAFAQELLADPSPLTIEQVREELVLEQERTTKVHPSWGACRVSNISVCGRMQNNHNHVERSLGIYGRGRAIYTLCINETVMKDAANNYAPIVKP